MQRASHRQTKPMLRNTGSYSGGGELARASARAEPNAAAAIAAAAAASVHLIADVTDKWGIPPQVPAVLTASGASWADASAPLVGSPFGISGQRPGWLNCFVSYRRHPQFGVNAVY